MKIRFTQIKSRGAAAGGCGIFFALLIFVSGAAQTRQSPQGAMAALEQLSKSSLSAGERAARLKEIAAEIEPTLGQTSDAQMLLGEGALLVKLAVEPDVNVLEYFGEDSADETKGRLQPIATTAVAIYDRATQLLDAKQTALQDRIARPGDEASLAWQKANQDFQTAAYTRWMLSYSLAISMDRADKNRALIAQEGIDHLAQWDNADSGVQPIVRLQMAKLFLMKGAHSDLVRARELLAGMARPHEVMPPPDRFTMFNVEYFAAIEDILAGDPEAAQRDANIAEHYRASALGGVEGDVYAMDMLRYRLALLREDNATAVKVLEELSDKAPGLRAVIAGQLLGRIPPHADPAKLPPLMLSALIERAWTEIGRPHPDKTILEEGLAAAQQYMMRADRGDGQTTAPGAMDASQIRGVILKALGEPADAAAAFIDHAQRYKSDPAARAENALNGAIDQIAALYHGVGNGAHQADVAALEDRLLPLAVDSFRRYELAYDYARRLQRSGQVAKAAAVFDLVPRDDPNALNALFFKMVALKQRLDAGPDDLANSVSAGQLPDVLGQVQALADQVVTIASKREGAATQPSARQFQSMRVRAILLGAEVAGGRGRDPNRALQLLKGFEEACRGLADAPALLADALNLRVAAYMEAGQTDAATRTLVQYLNTVGGNEGLQTVYNLLSQLNGELDKAQAAGDGRRVKELADDRAALTPFLVKWAEANTNRDIAKYTYRYRVFDAATQKQSAELESDAGKRAAKLAAALGRYKELQSAENVKLYRDSLAPDVGRDARDYPDPAVTLGIGEVAFAMGDWKLAHDSIGQLLADSRLGDGTTVVKNAAGQDEVTDNDQFWEAQYKFIRATAELARDKSSGVKGDTAKIIFARLKVIWQERIGGTKWRREFEELGKELDSGVNGPG